VTTHGVEGRRIIDRVLGSVLTGRTLMVDRGAFLWA